MSIAYLADRGLGVKGYMFTKGIKIIVLSFALGLIVSTQNCGFTGMRANLDGSYSSTSVPIFNIQRNTVKLLPFSVRLTKIQALLPPGSTALLNELIARQNELGGYDYANGVNQELTWTETRIGIWVKALQPICASGAIKGKFPYPNSATTFVEAAYGRKVTDVDTAILGQISSAAGNNDQKFESLCTVILSSLEFTTL
jgi:hypothetical protein